MRLFIAIHTPSEIVHLLRKIQNRIVRSEWLRARNVDVQDSHVTLVFLGEQSITIKEKIRRALCKIEFQKFSMRISYASSFPRRGAPKVIYAGFTPSKHTLDLHKKIQSSLKPIMRLSEQEKRFHPHITLARVKEVCNRDALVRELTKEIQPLEIEVAEFGLYESKLAPQGSKYKLLETFRAQDI